MRGTVTSIPDKSDKLMTHLTPYGVLWSAGNTDLLAIHTGAVKITRQAFFV